MLKPSPNRQVIEWIETGNEETLFLSVLTIGEIYKGINKLQDSKRKKDIQRWMRYDLHQRFEGRILGINEKIARIWGELQGKAEKTGKKMPVIDSLLAATGICYNLILVTRNISDIELSEASVFNPWTE
jgi:toxin FitB